ncbi:MAG TPA: PRC-barrel domain-containing protein [Chitinispirillaceae bacterium]|nr:PRC-barrel domain-containing protein [Chitinispirillaceae bacterium]
MFRGARHCYNLAVEATDGPVGRVEQFLFDDQNWAIRYIIVDIGSWILGKRVLISPASVVETRRDQILLKNTMEQIQNSPSVDTANPVSRLEEQRLHNYYSWPFYWVYPAGYNSLGAALYPGLTRPYAYQPLQDDYAMAEQALLKENQLEEEIRKSHLRKTKEVSGYAIQATDEQIGHVEDFIVDDTHWVIRYLVIETRNIIPGKRVLIAPQWTRGIDWNEAMIYVDFDRETIKDGPEFDPMIPLTRDMEKRLYNYYERPKYWEDN